MRHRSWLGALLLTVPVLAITSCSNDPSLTSIVIFPSGYTALLGPCGQAQVQANFTATGYYTHPGHQPISKDITNKVTWKSFDTQLVAIDSTGLASVTTCATPGSTFQSSTPISASAPGFHGLVIAYATFDEVEPTSTTTGNARTLTLTPETANGTVRFTAVGKSAEGAVVALKNQPVWYSTDNQVATIDKESGAVAMLASGRTTITAVYTNPDGSTAIGVLHYNVAR